MSCRDGFCFSIFSIHNKNNSWTSLASVGAAGRVCTNTSGDAGMKKASTRLLEQETQTPSPAPDLIPAESSTENLHWDWYSKRGHFISHSVDAMLARRLLNYVVKHPERWREIDGS